MSDTTTTDNVAFATDDEGFADPELGDAVLSGTEPFAAEPVEPAKAKAAPRTRSRSRAKPKPKAKATATPPADRAPRGPGRPSKSEQIAGQLASFYETVGILLAPMAPMTSAAFIMQAEPCAKSVADWAAVNPRVRQAVERLVNVSGGAGVAMAHLPILMAAVGEVQTRRAQAAGDEATTETTGPLDAFRQGFVVKG